jgi:hypothetical protein
MKARLLFVLWFLLHAPLLAQQFSVDFPKEPIRAAIGETVQAPVSFQNNDSKAIILIIKKIKSNLGSTQKSLFCVKGNCITTKNDEQAIRLEPLQLLTDFSISLEAGLGAGVSSARYSVSSKTNPLEVIEFDLDFTVEEMEKTRKGTIYDSRFITLHDVYPNPAVEIAHIDYRIHRTEPAYYITVRNLLGNIISNYKLDQNDNTLKIRTDDLNTGIYFFTLYIGSEGVVTRKMVVKK